MPKGFKRASQNDGQIYFQMTALNKSYWILETCMLKNGWFMYWLTLLCEKCLGLKNDIFNLDLVVKILYDLNMIIWLQQDYMTWTWLHDFNKITWLEHDYMTWIYYRSNAAIHVYDHVLALFLGKDTMGRYRVWPYDLNSMNTTILRRYIRIWSKLCHC